MKKLMLRIPMKDIQVAPARHEALTPQQIACLQKLQATLAEVDNSLLEKWIDDFKRDENPDREIAVFEAIAQAYQTFCAAHPRTLPQKHDAYSLLSERSGTTDEDALRSYKRNALTEDEAKEVLSYYHKAATPIQVYENPANPFFLRKITGGQGCGVLNFTGNLL